MNEQPQATKADDLRGLFYACLLNETRPGEQPLTQAAEEAVDLMATFRPGRGASLSRVAVRFYGEKQGGCGAWAPCLYHAEVSNLAAAAPRLAKRWATEIRKRRSRPTKTRTKAAERTTLVRVYFPEARVLSGTTSRADLPGGVRLDVYGDKEHALQLEHLTAQQLAAVLHAIAETLNSKGKR